MKRSETEIIFVWTKSHSGIDGNEYVDLKAKESCNSPDILKITLYSDILNICKNLVVEKWSKNYKEVASASKNHYFQINSELPKPSQCLLKLNMSKEHSSIISRLKFNHGRFRAHLHKIGMAETPFCTCNNSALQDLNHIFFECSRYPEKIESLLSDLISMKIALPINIAALLAINNRDVMDLLVKFVKEMEITL